MFANYAYDLAGNLVLFLAFFGATASLIQMFQIGNLRRRLESLEEEAKQTMLESTKGLRQGLLTQNKKGGNE
tara:strand:+ start:125 stop:340 length:216 start_codon:yes stop_codon:yes gene_type:complete